MHEHSLRFVHGAATTIFRLFCFVFHRETRMLISIEAAYSPISNLRVQVHLHLQSMITV